MKKSVKKKSAFMSKALAGITTGKNGQRNTESVIGMRSKQIQTSSGLLGRRQKDNIQTNRDLVKKSVFFDVW